MGHVQRDQVIGSAQSPGNELFGPGMGSCDRGGRMLVCSDTD